MGLVDNDFTPHFRTPGRGTADCMTLEPHHQEIGEKMSASRLKVCRLHQCQKFKHTNKQQPYWRGIVVVAEVR